MFSGFCLAANAKSEELDSIEWNRLKRPPPPVSLMTTQHRRRPSSKSHPERNKRTKHNISWHFVGLSGFASGFGALLSRCKRRLVVVGVGCELNQTELACGHKNAPPQETNERAAFLFYSIHLDGGRKLDSIVPVAGSHTSRQPASLTPFMSDLLAAALSSLGSPLWLRVTRGTSVMQTRPSRNLWLDRRSQLDGRRECRRFLGSPVCGADYVQLANVNFNSQKPALVSGRGVFGGLAAAAATAACYLLIGVSGRWSIIGPAGAHVDCFNQDRLQLIQNQSARYKTGD